jgi:hypothetical protein
MEDQIPDPIPVDVTETIAYSLLNDAEKLEQVHTEYFRAV